MSNDPTMDALLSMISGGSAPINRKLYFPKGSQFKAWRIKSRSRSWRFCYSVNRNERGKFCSWVYRPIRSARSSMFKMARLVEHRKKKDAIARAYKLFCQESNKRIARRKKNEKADI